MKPPISVSDLSRVLFGRGTSGHLAMLTAYFDESETQNATPRYFVVSGYVSDERGWKGFQRKWWAALVQDGFQKHGLHWTDLASGRGDFSALAGEENRKARERLQRKYIAIIKKSHLQGIYAAFDIADFERILPTIKKVRPTKKLQSPYYHAFESAIGRLCALLRDGNLIDPEEKIAFVFDRKKEIEGRAKALYDGIVEQGRVWFAKHLGSLSFAASQDFLPLQASDALANEVQRDLGRGNRARRPQFERLIEGNQVADYVFTGELFDKFADRLEEKIAAYFAETQDGEK